MGNNVFIGGWLDVETKQYFLDITYYTKDFYLASSIGTIFKQLCIYDCKNNKVIGSDKYFN